MVESTLKTVVYIDYTTALGIAKQILITTLSTAKTNLRVVRTSDFLYRFRNLKIRYKLGNKYIVPNALSRLYPN